MSELIESQARPPHQSRWVGSILLTVTLAAGFLRFTQIHQVGLSHFDAGVYAQSSLWPWTGEFHFSQGYFSPPLFPLLTGALQWVVGFPFDWAGAAISAAAGTALVPIVFKLASYWRDERAGLTAATLVAVDPVLIHFSRIGLTDSLFLLLFMASLSATFRALIDGGWARLLWAGIAVGLAWNTKYHGALPWVLSICLILRDNWSARLGRWLVVGGVAGACYLPWATWFHVKHGYQTLIDHQRGYWVGWPSLLEGWTFALESWSALGVAPFFLAPFMLWAYGKRLGGPSTSPEFGWLWGFGLFLGWSIPFRSTLDLLLPFLLAAWGFSFFWGKRVLAVGQLAVGLVLMVLPALYTSYARLWLPTEVFLLITLCCGISASMDAPRGLGRPWTVVAFLSAILLSLGGAWIWFVRDSHFQTSLRPHAGYREVADQLARAKFRGEIRTLCRWPMNYYLAMKGLSVRPEKGEPSVLDELGPEDVFVFDRTAWNTASFRPSAARARARSAPFPARLDLDEVTLLDERPGRRAETDELPADGLWIFPADRARKLLTE